MITLNQYQTLLSSKGMSSKLTDADSSEMVATAKTNNRNAIRLTTLKISTALEAVCKPYNQARYK